MSRIEDALPSSKTWLKIMLWAIAFGAAAGVAAVLFVPLGAIYRVTGTSFLLAGGALLMMLAGNLVDRERTRASGLLGMGLVIVIFFLALALIWDLHRLIGAATGLSQWRAAEALWTTIGWLLLIGTPSLFVLRLIQSDRSRLAGWVGLILAGISFICLMIGTVLHAAGAADPERWLLTGMWIGLMGALVVGCLAGVQRLPDRPWVWIGVAAAAAAAAMGILGAWTEIETRLGENLTVCFISAAVAVSYANTLLHFPIRPQHRWVTSAAILIATGTAVVVGLYVFSTPRWYDTPSESGTAFQELLERVMIAGAILSATGLLAIAVLARLYRPLAIERSAKEIREVTLICPVCRNRQQLPTGESAACRTCGLRIDIKVAEPRCPKCDYLLYHLQSPNCPECGHGLRAP